MRLDLDEFCPLDPVTEAHDLDCLAVFQARVAEAQQLPVDFLAALPFVGLFLVFAIGLALGRGR